MRNRRVTAAPALTAIARASVMAVKAARVGVALLLICAGARVQAAEHFAVSSANWHDGAQVASAQIFNESGCEGRNHSPQLSWRNAPAGTRSFAVTVFDPDAPGRGWWHWAVANIPARVASLPENASASGALKKLGAIEARNDFGGDGYGGPCPPPGKPHRYVVTVYALRVDRLALAPGRPGTMFEHEIEGAALGSATITVTYGR